MTKSQDDVILRLEQSIAPYTLTVEHSIAGIEQAADRAIADLQISVSDKAGRYIFDLSPLVTRLYLSANYHYLRVMFYSSPGLWAVLLAIYQGVLVIVSILKTFADIIHLADIIKAAQIVRIIWPSFRRWWDGIMRQVSDFSEQLGWGVDGISHLLNTATTCVTIVGGLRGELPSTNQWWRFERTQKALLQFGILAEQWADDPAALIGQVFDSEQYNVASETEKWWTKTSAWIENATDLADKAFMKASELFYQIAKLEDFLPVMVRNYIPRELWDGLRDANDYIEGTILPAISQVNRTFSEINAVLEAQRQHTAALVDQLTRPGDLLLGFEDLTEAGQWDQLSKIDDVTSRKFLLDTEEYEGENTIIMRQLESVSRAVSAPTPAPSFLRLEDIVRNPVRTPGAKYYSTWQIGDY